MVEATTDILKSAQRAMQDGRFDAAVEALAPLAAGEEPDVQALYLTAVCERYAGRKEKAHDVLTRLKRLAPDFARARQEEGHLLREEGRTGEALAAYAAACRLNPALEASWRFKGDLARGLGREAEARAAQAEAARLKALPKEVFAAYDLLHEGQPVKAEKLCKAFLKRNPSHVEGMRVLAAIAVKLSVLDDAETLLEGARALAPENIQVRLDYVDVLRRRQKYAAARDEAKALLDREPDNPVFQSRYAVELLQTGDFEGAIAFFDKVLERLPEDPATLTSRGHALKTYGRREDAVASYRAAIEAKPDHGDAYSALANLKTYRFDDEEVAAMVDLAAREDVDPMNRIHLDFALGKAFEDRGDHDAAFRHFVAGNARKKSKSRYDADVMAAEFAAQEEICTPAFFEARRGGGDPAPDPVFIVGLPRAGSTLVEQILASHSQVDGTLELPDILALVRRLRGRGPGRDRYPRVLADLSEEDRAAFGRRYLDDTRVHRGDAPFFTDKMPNNFRHVGLIKLILPNAKIIDARRHPLACCWSAFQQLFAEGQEFSNDLEDLGRYYRGYVDLMDHWDRALPGRVLRVIHEDVVDDLEGQVRRILEFCGLAFEEACVAFHETERAVRTASSEQVRRPINREGLERWRAYEDHLGPLKDALGPALDDWRRDGAAGR